MQIDRLQIEGKTIIIVGGTGLYLKSITQPFVEIPNIDPGVRSGIAASIIENGLEKYYNELQYVDPSSALKIAPHDSQRISRALEVFKATGKPLSIWQTEHCLQPQHDFNIVLMQPPRSELNCKAEKRIDEMLTSGAIDEIKALIDQAIPITAAIYRALGARELWQYLHHQLTLDEAAVLVKQVTRQYIKRQYTWFRHQLKANFILDDNNSIQQFIAQL